MKRSELQIESPDLIASLKMKGYISMAVRTLTPKEVALEWDSDARTVRKFLRADAKVKGLENPGKGARWAVEARKLKSLRKGFDAWVAEKVAKAAEAADAAASEDEAPESPEVLEVTESPEGDEVLEDDEVLEEG